MKWCPTFVVSFWRFR